MKKYYFLIVLTLILGLVLTGCSLLSNISQVPTNDQSEVSGLTKGEFDVECPAAPAVAGLLLEAAGVDNRYGTGKDGGNFIKDVANFMWPETDFNGVSKCSIIAYECAVAAFLNDPENGENYPAEVTSQYAGILDPVASGATFQDNENRTGTMFLTVLNMCGGGIEGLELIDIEVDIQWVGLTDLFTLSAGGYWDIELVEIGNGDYKITFQRTGSVPYIRLWDVIVMDEIIEDDLSVVVTCPTTEWSSTGTFNSTRYLPGLWSYNVTITRDCDDEFVSGVIELIDPDSGVVNAVVEDVKKNYAYWYDMIIVSKPNLAAVGTATYGTYEGNFMFLLANSHIWMALGQEDYYNEWENETVWLSADRDYDIWSSDGGFWQ